MQPYSPAEGKSWVGFGRWVTGTCGMDLSNDYASKEGCLREIG